MEHCGQQLAGTIGSSPDPCASGIAVWPDSSAGSLQGSIYIYEGGQIEGSVGHTSLTETSHSTARRVDYTDEGR
jgi:hypothetical protein